MGTIICWLVALTILVGGGLLFYLLAIKGGELALKQDRAKHLAILNEARRRSGKPPLTDLDLPAEKPSPTTAEALRMVGRDVKETFFDQVLESDRATDARGGFEVTTDNVSKPGGKAGGRAGAERSPQQVIPIEESIDTVPARSAGGVVTPMPVLPIEPPPIPAAYTDEAGQTQPTGQPAVSLVLLESAHKTMTEAEIRDAIQNAWGVIFPVGDAGATEWVVYPGEPSPAMVSCGGFRFLIQVVACPYFDDAGNVAAEVHEARTRQAMLACKAWRSVDYLSSDDDVPGLPPARPGVEIMALLAKLAAELARPSTLGFIFTDSNRFFPCTEATLKALQTDNPVTTLERTDVQWVPTITDEDGELKAAMERAREEFPTFVLAFEGRSRGSPPFLIKAAFRDGGRRIDDGEQMWVEVTAIEQDRVLGYLRSEPVQIQGLTKDQRVTVAAEDVTDWIAFSNDRPLGNFTSAIVAKLAKRQQGDAP